MKSLSLCMVLALGIVSLAWPQTLEKQSRAQSRTKNLQKLLSLNDEQSRQVGAILSREATQSAKDEESYGGNRRAMMKAARGRQAGIDEQIESLLTQEQRVKYQAYKKARRSEFDNRRRLRGSEYD